VLSYYLEQIFGFGISENRNKGANFYTQSFQLGDKERNYGIVCMGGNKDTVCVELTATGLGAAADGWENRLYQFANLPQVDSFRFTRVDVARDFFNGEYTIEKVLEAYRAGEFTLSITRPQLRREGLDWDNDTQKGRTLYIGSRQSSRLVRAYEKGKQLGDENSPWLRVELELRSRDLRIPLDILLHAGECGGPLSADVVPPGSAGAAGVHEEGALARRAGGQVLLHRDLNGLPTRLGIIQRHGDLGALKTGPVSRLLHSGSGHAVIPLDLLTIEGLQPLGNRRLRRRSHSRPCGGQRSSRNRTGPHPQTHSRHSSQHPSRHPTMPEASGSSPFVHNREQGPIGPIPWMMLRSRYRFHTEDGMNRSVSV